MPYGLTWDDAPLDLSDLYQAERPAGQHGFMRVTDGELAFEDGTPGRFWGTNFNGGPCFGSHEQSLMVARRLAKFGVNLVRLHQMDPDWATPNIFQFNRAVAKEDTRTLDPTSMERLDFLIKCLKAEGIYIYLDLITYRKFRLADGVENAPAIREAGKPYVYFDPRMIELQKEFNAAVWSHENPHTGLAYKDDPAIILTCITNECDFFTQPPVTEPYRSRLEVRFREWAGARSIDVPDGQQDFTAPTAGMAEFFGAIQAAYYADMAAHLREIGVRVPIAGTNWRRSLMIVEAHRDTDFEDTHWYWDLGRWEQPPSPMVKQKRTPFVQGVFARAPGKPLFVSEWGHLWPQEWRAESPLAYAAVGSFQGWAGLAHEGYRYANHGPVDRIGGGASTLNGIVDRNQLDAFNDPAVFGLFYHAALMFRRGDVRRAAEKVVVGVGAENEAWRLMTIDARKCGPDDVPELTLTPETHETAMAIPGEGAAPAAPASESSETTVRSDTGELGRDWAQGVGWIDTPSTKAVYGFVGEGDPIELDGLKVTAQTDFATIAISSLTSTPIRDSTCLLLTAVGRCDNTGTKLSEDRSRLLDLGHAPVIVEVIEAQLRLQPTREDLKVWVIGEHGQAVRALDVAHEDGWMTFDIGVQPALTTSSIFYLLRV
jgi:hypothetical protein